MNITFFKASCLLIDEMGHKGTRKTAPMMNKRSAASGRADAACCHRDANFEALEINIFAPTKVVETNNLYFYPLCLIKNKLSNIVQNVSIRPVKAQVLIKMKCCRLKFMTKKLAGGVSGFQLCVRSSIFSHSLLAAAGQIR